MTICLRTVIASCLLVVSTSLSAQVNSLSRADNSFNNAAYSQAAEQYVEEIKRGDAPDYAIHNLAECYRMIRDTKNAEVWFAQAVQLRDRTPEEVFNYAQALKSNKKYAEANNWFRLYNELVPEDRRAIMHLTAGNYEKNLNPVVQHYKISNLSINTSSSDFGASYFGDNAVVFSSNYDDNSAAVERTWTWRGNEFLDLYISDIVAQGALNTPQKFSKALNSKYHEGPVSFSNDGLQIYFTRNGKIKNKKGLSKNGFLNLKIYRAALAGNDFVNIEPLPFCSDEYNVCHPSMSQDGKRLYFASDMPGGYGGYDLYMVRFDRGFWGRPENLGAEINTEGNETFPFIHRSGKLYFASDGHVGLGGNDIFSAERVRGVFKNVKNLMAPINSNLDDFAYVADSAGTIGYFSSNREGGVGSDDIYTFIYEEQTEIYNLQGQVVDDNDFTVADVTVYVQNEKGAVLGKTVSDEDGFFSFQLNRYEGYNIVTQSKQYTQSEMEIPVFPAGDVKTVAVRVSKSTYSLVGIVLEEETNLKLSDVNVKLIKSSSRQAREAVTNASGKFAFVLDPNAVYTIKASKPGFITKSKVISTSGARQDVPLEVDDLFLSRIVENQIIEIPNVLYDLGKFAIRPDAALELDKVVDFLQDNPGISVELSSHSDARGDAVKNLELSQKRAQAATDYIVSKGISEARILAKGYGESQLKNNCKDGVKCSEAQHQVNRRTEIKIVSIN